MKNDVFETIQLFLQESISGVYIEIVSDKHMGDLLLITSSHPSLVWIRLVGAELRISNKSWPLDTDDGIFCSRIDLSDPNSLLLLQVEVKRILDNW